MTATMSKSTMSGHRTVNTGDVLEIGSADNAATVLVLLASDEAVVLDPCNGETPFVVRLEELGEFRRFDVDDVLVA